ncbi:MAG: hypothetical protein AVDCRST_MAG90-619, partial [uncultured Microvirga sp.]
ERDRRRSGGTGQAGSQGEPEAPQGAGARAGSGREAALRPYADGRRHETAARRVRV